MDSRPSPVEISIAALIMEEAMGRMRSTIGFVIFGLLSASIAGPSWAAAVGSTTTRDLTAPEPPKRNLQTTRPLPHALTPIGPETCLGIDPNRLTITGGDTPVNPGSGAEGSWLLKLSDSKAAFVLAYLDTKSDAERIIFLIKARNWNRVCWVGNRGGASFHYMLSASE
jgi:hypothetical protein